jgi:hypothetical protein
LEKNQTKFRKYKCSIGVGIEGEFDAVLDVAWLSLAAAPHVLSLFAVGDLGCASDVVNFTITRFADPRASWQTARADIAIGFSWSLMKNFDVFGLGRIATTAGAFGSETMLSVSGVKSVVTNWEKLTP